jgi:hypothetical protein
MKKLIFILFSIFSMLTACLTFCTGCKETPTRTSTLKYIVNTGIDIADDAGIFKNRMFVLKKKYRGDTTIYYNGINNYFIKDADTAFVFYFKPSVKNIKDTINHFLTKKQAQKNE